MLLTIYPLGGGLCLRNFRSLSACHLMSYELLVAKGDVGVLHGAMSYLLQDDDGQIIEPHSISAG